MLDRIMTDVQLVTKSQLKLKYHDVTENIYIVKEKLI